MQVAKDPYHYGPSADQFGPPASAAGSSFWPTINDIFKAPDSGAAAAFTMPVDAAPPVSVKVSDPNMVWAPMATPSVPTVVTSGGIFQSLFPDTNMTTSGGKSKPKPPVSGDYAGTTTITTSVSANTNSWSNVLQAGGKNGWKAVLLDGEQYFRNSRTGEFSKTLKGLSLSGLSAVTGKLTTKTMPVEVYTSKTNWALIGGGIAAAAIAGLVLWKVLKR